MSALQYDEWHNSPFEQFMDRVGLHSALEGVALQYHPERSQHQWSARITFDRCDWMGYADDPETAVVEAWVDYLIGQHYYGSDEELTWWAVKGLRTGVYLRAGIEPEGEYRGDYHVTPPSVTAEAQP